MGLSLKLGQEREGKLTGQIRSIHLGRAPGFGGGTPNLSLRLFEVIDLEETNLKTIVCGCGLVLTHARMQVSSSFLIWT